MSVQIKLRQGTASSWVSTNPTLLQGEPGVETDTGRFKIGDGLTVWTSLAYASSAGPAQTNPYRSLGDGADGNVGISSGTTTLTRDMYYNNLTMSGSGILVTNGFKVFVKGVLDISNAAVGAIQWNGIAGGDASGATAGATPASQPGGTMGDIASSGPGSTATTGTGTSGGAASTVNATLGGRGGRGGQGGSGVSGNAAASSGARNPVFATNFRRFATCFLSNKNALAQGGVGGTGGSAGSGDSFFGVVGGGSGAGGNGGGAIALYVNIFVKSSNTPAFAIQCNGGNGGLGAVGGATFGSTGGGGGGAGGGGGWIYLAYNSSYGPTIFNLLQADGGLGGDGGRGYGGGTGGAGGDSGGGGRITILQIPTSTCSEATINTDAVELPEIPGSSKGIGNAGGAGGFGGILRVSF